MQQALIDKGILRSYGEIVKEKINLISGAHIPPFVEMLWTVMNGDTDTTDRVYTLLSGLYADGRETEMMEVLRTLYGLLAGPAVLGRSGTAGRTPGGTGLLLFSFLLDYDDAMEGYKDEQDGA